MKKAEFNNWKVSISVVHAGGHLVAFDWRDGAVPATARIPYENAHSAAIFRDATPPMEDRIAIGPGTIVLPGAMPLKGEFRSLPAGR
ncbi:heme-binding protein [Rhizobiaceae sp. 2RAB30]